MGEGEEFDGVGLRNEEMDDDQGGQGSQWHPYPARSDVNHGRNGGRLTDLVIDEPVFADRERTSRLLFGPGFASPVRKRLDSRSIGLGGLFRHGRSSADAKWGEFDLGEESDRPRIGRAERLQFERDQGQRMGHSSERIKGGGRGRERC
jgi:hypothetical protein